ncbi:bifunctional aspartate kinase/diaminopimelate decarboxylase [Xanthomonadaceae bacterium JHOS43]|nr:bifunctional aspartate kinase/diaminopimelate decarboxylase [Xanthomonadaceae bacterium JHOS43]
MSQPDLPGASSVPWVVLKFGGTSVSSRARWNTIGDLVAKRQSEGFRVLVVVSAMSGVTNALAALSESGGVAAVARIAQAAALEARHREFAAVLELDADAVLADLFGSLQSLANDPRATDTALDWQAEVLALGELFSSRLGSAYLSSRGLDLRWSDARRFLRALVLPNQSAWSARLSVNCDTRPEPDFRTRYSAQGDTLITQGFICADVSGRTAILGRGGSDTSAACFGALLGAARVETWTDVPGMFSANPRQVPQARLLTRLDYEEAQEIASTGAKVLHPRCISPCREARVPLWIRDTSRPDFEGTVIGPRLTDSAPGVKAISTKRGIVLVSMDGIGMWQQVGFLADVFERFKRHGLSVDLIGSSEANVTVSLDPSDNLVSSDVLERLAADLSEVCRVKVIAPCAAITLVGRGMRSLLHKLSDVLAEFGRERVHLISQSSNDLNLTFVVDESVAEGMLPRLHELLIHAQAMPVDEAAVFGPSWKALQRGATPLPRPWWAEKREALLEQVGSGTPRYVYDLATLRATARAFRGLGALDRRFYSIKANPHPAILRALEEEGFGFECVSGGELDHVFSLFPGIDPTRVLFTPSFAARSEYEAALGRDVWVTLDSTYPLTHWPELFRGRDLWLRLDPGYGRGHHEKMRTGGGEARFGLPPDGVDAFVVETRKLGARIFGLHAHPGSGIFDVAHWRDVFGRLAGVADRLGTVEALNLGGGLGVAASPEADPFDLDALADVLAQARVQCPQYSLWMAPGRFLVGEAGVLLVRATQVVEKAGLLRVGVDAGMNALMRPALCNARHEVANLTRLDETGTVLCDIVGPICESGDVLARRRRLPSTREGDVLLVSTAGAYGAVMASAYNLRGLPAEAVLDD